MTCKIIAAMVLTAAMAITAAAADEWCGDYRLLGKITARTLPGDGVVISAETQDRALMTGSKFIADMLAYGDVKALDDGKTFEIPGVGYRHVGQKGNRIAVIAAPSLPLLAQKVERAGFGSDAAVARNAYPKWFDRFDNNAVSMGALGWGILPQDYRDGMDWIGENHFDVLAENNNPNLQLAPGVWDDTVTRFYRAVAKKYDVTYQIYIPWAMPDFPAFFWEKSPLPWFQPANGGAIAHPRLDTQRLTSHSWYEPVHNSRDMIATMYYELARRTARDPDFSNHFGIVEIGRNMVLICTGYANTPDAVAAWQKHLDESLKGDCRIAGQLIKNDENAYQNWRQVELPTMLNVINRSNDFLDLRGEWEMFYDPSARSQPPADAQWRRIDCNDPLLAILERAPGKFWMRRTFELPAGKKYDYLHISRNAWHGKKNQLFAVWLNGRDPRDLTIERSLTGDLDQCLDIKDLLQPGQNTILISANQPVAHYILLNNEGRFVYPGPDELQNQLFFELSEFVVKYRLEGIENVLRAIRAGDPDGRPIQVMAPTDLIDKIEPVLRRYGAYAHDTGQTGDCWAPWMTRYTATHGLPISAEPGWAPESVLKMRQMMTLYIMTGDDAINFLFDPTQYRQQKIDQWIAQNREIINTAGKLELPQGDIGVLRSPRNASRLLSTAAWSQDLSRGVIQAAGRTCNLVTLTDFVDGRIPFDTVIDGGTTIMTENEAAAIAEFVRNGGTFIATQYSGVHTEKQTSARPLAALFGIKTLDSNVSGEISFNDTQTLWPNLRGKSVPARGIAMQKNDPAVQEIAQWSGRSAQSGNLAVAMRPLGKGRFILVGSDILNQSRDQGGSFTVDPAVYPYLPELLDALGVPRSSGGCRDLGMQSVFAEKWRSKNGLYDVYMLAYINNKGDAVNAGPRYFHADRPETLREFSAAGHPEVKYQYQDGVLALPAQKLEPMELRTYAAPRPDPVEPVLFWLQTLQKRQYALAPAEAPLPDRPDGDVIALNDGWTVVSATPDPAGITGKQVNLGTFLELGLPDDAVVHLRKTFALPERWQKQKIELGFSCQYWYWGLVPNGQILLNGQPWRQFAPKQNGGFAANIDDQKENTLDLEIDGRLAAGVKRTRPSGVTGIFYARSMPLPQKVIAFDTWKKADAINDFVKVKTGKRRSFIYLENEFETPVGDWDSIALESPEPLGWLCLNGVWLSLPGNQRRLNVSGLLRHDGKPNVLRWMPGLIKESPNVGRVLTETIPPLFINCYQKEKK